MINKLHYQGIIIIYIACMTMSLHTTHATTSFEHAIVDTVSEITRIKCINLFMAVYIHI